MFSLQTIFGPAHSSTPAVQRGRRRRSRQRQALHAMMRRPRASKVAGRPSLARLRASGLPTRSARHWWTASSPCSSATSKRWDRPCDLNRSEKFADRFTRWPQHLELYRFRAARGTLLGRRRSWCRWSTAAGTESGQDDRAQRPPALDRDAGRPADAGTVPRIYSGTLDPGEMFLLRSSSRSWKTIDRCREGGWWPKSC